VRKTLVAGIGNVFFGDDGFGVEVAARLAIEHLGEGVRVLDAGIRARHLAYEILDGGYERVILVDAVSRGGAPGTIYLIEPDVPGDRLPPAAAALDGHSMSPETVLTFLRMLGSFTPSVLIVGCEPDRLDEAMGLSVPVARAVEEAVALVRDLVASAPGRAGACA
jgi:hydrogenase maturation protease